MVANILLPEDLYVRIRELESEVKHLQRKVDELQKFSFEHSEQGAMAVGHVVEGMSIVRYYANMENVDLKDLDGAFESLDELENLYEKCKSAKEISEFSKNEGNRNVWKRMDILCEMNTDSKHTYEDWCGEVMDKASILRELSKK